jgi:hypothetical protein
VSNLWSSSLGSDNISVSNDLLKSQASMFRSRAVLFQIVSLILLASTASLICVGIVTFVRGDVGDDVLAKEEVDLQVELARIQAEIDSLSTGSAAAKAALSTLERAKTLSSVLGRAKSGVLGLLASPSESLLKSTLKVITASSEIVGSTQKEPMPSRVEIFVSDVVTNDSNSFPAAAVETIKQSASKQSVDLNTLDIEFKSVAKVLNELVSAEPASDGGLPPLSSRMDSLKVVTEGLDQFVKLDALDSEVNDLRAKAERELQEILEGSTDREQTRQALEKQKSDTEAQLTEVRQKREKILFMAWVPSLTLRVGTVVLLLFLTQILLTSYRYTVGLSAFYLARCDAIRLLQPVGDVHSFQVNTNDLLPARNGQYSANELAVLIGLLSPESHRVDAVTDPSGQFTDLAKAWIARR